MSCKVVGNLHKHSFGWLRGPGWMCHQLETRSPLEGGLCGRYRSRYRFLDFSRKTFVFLYPRGSKIDPRGVSDEKIKNRNRWENVWCLASPIFSTIGSVLLTLAPRGVGWCRSEIWIFLKSASRLLPDRWVEVKISDCRCHFRAFQLELNTLDTKKFEIGSVGTKLQLFEVGWFLENLRMFVREIHLFVFFCKKKTSLILEYPNRFKESQLIRLDSDSY